MAYTKQVQGLALVGFTDSGHQVTMDTRKEVGGFETAPTPMELLVQSLIGCTAMDVLSILKKMRVDLSDFTVEESHEKAQEHPKVYTRIKLTYSFRGEDLDHSKIKKAVLLSKDRYCPVTAMLRGSVDLDFEILINGQSVEVP